MMPQDDLRAHRELAAKRVEQRVDQLDDVTSHGALALWVIAEQLGAIAHSLSVLQVLADAVDPSAGEKFPGFIRTVLERTR